MKRYLVFAGPVYYPLGGMDDFVEDYDFIDPALDRAKEEKNRDTYGSPEYLWAQVYDTKTREIICQL